MIRNEAIKIKCKSKWRAGSAGRCVCTAERLSDELITCRWALTGLVRGDRTHLRRGLPKGGFSQVASLGEMSQHCECSANTKVSNGSSPPSLATHTALRERKYTAFTRPPLTGQVTESGSTWEAAQRKRKREEREREMDGPTTGMERLPVSSFGVSA